MTVSGDPTLPGDQPSDAPVAAPVTLGTGPPSRTTSGSSPRPPLDPLAEVCPYLSAGDGSWQSAHALRDQRCGAVEPSVPLTPAKQRSLCLVTAHRSCATYLAAQELAASSAASRARAIDHEPTLWPVTRSRLLVLEPERRLLGLGGSRVRVGGQIGLIGLMAVAFLLLVVARGTSPSTPVGGGASASAFAVVSPTPRVTPSPAASASPSSGPSATPRPTPRSTNGPNRQRYRIKAGDTLSDIALKFGTTLKVLKRINDITDPTLIRPGQVILVPAR
jgi:LysM repeat protein